MNASVATPCRIPDCPKPRFRRSLCRMHYDRKRRYGGPGPAGKIGRSAPLLDRFTNNVLVDGPLLVPALGACSQWTGHVHSKGFGVIGHNYRLIYVHRLAWELAYGSIPPRTLIGQVCGNRLCVRADHLRATTTTGQVMVR